MRPGATSIRTTTQALVRPTTARRSEKSQKSKARLIGRLFKSSKKRVTRVGLLATHFILLIVIAGLVISGSRKNGVSAEHSLISTPNTSTATAVDELSATDIAVHIARATQLEEAVAVTNQADSNSINLVLTSNDQNIIAKPQIVATGLKTRKDISTYIVQQGDTVSSVAAKFGVTSQTIRWSNNLNSDSLNAGAKLVISPVNGIVYTVATGDTLDSIARKYHANKDQLTAFNDAELTGNFAVGEQIVIPDGVPPAPTVNSYFNGFAFGGSAIYGYNGYYYGWCTWYVASRVRVPANWGNANTWDDGARAAGWYVGPVPRAGWVAQTNAGWQGHVAYVEAVSDDGTMIKYSDMNGLAGFGRVGYSDWVPVSHFQNYIYQ